MFCHKCGEENLDDSIYCAKCGTQIQQPPQVANYSAAEDPALRLLIPIGRSGLAIAAGYVGLFAVLLVPAPFAILLGVLALKDIKRNPKKMGRGRAIFGIIMGILGSIGLIAFAVSMIVNRATPLP